MDIDALQETLGSHYENVRERLRSHLLSMLNACTTDELRILEVGPASRSILLQAIESVAKWVVEHQLSPAAKTLRVHFIDEFEGLARIAGDTLTCVIDQGANPAGRLQVDPFTLHWTLEQRDFNDLTPLSSDKSRYHLIVLHSVLHEIYSSGSKAFDEHYLDVFQRLHCVLEDGGYLFIGDHYFPPYSESRDSHEYVKMLIQATQHGNAPVSFVHPECLLTIVLNIADAPYDLLLDEERYHYLRLRDQSGRYGRKSYLLILQRSAR